MGFIGKITENIISKLKKDPSYRFKVQYTDRQLVTIIWLRALQAVRGIFLRTKIAHASGIIFAGRGVVIEHGYQIKSGSSLILEDGVHINALSEHGITLGRNVTIAKFAIIVCTGVVANKGVGINIGDYSAVGAQSFLGGQGGITLGNNVIMGPGVRIFTENHNYSDLSVPIRLQGETRSSVVIEDGCWIGSGVTILAGVIIGAGSLIAAGSVVTKNIPGYSVAAGIPAKVLKSRGNG